MVRKVLGDKFQNYLKIFFGTYSLASSSCASRFASSQEFPQQKDSRVPWLQTVLLLSDKEL